MAAHGSVVTEPLAVLAARALVGALPRMDEHAARDTRRALLRYSRGGPSALLRHVPYSLLRLLLMHDAFRNKLALSDLSFACLNASMRVEEDALRARFAAATTGATSAAAAAAAVRSLGGGLVLQDVFANPGEYHHMVGAGADVRSYDQLEASAPLIYAHQARTANAGADGTSMLAASSEEFAVNFDAFTSGLLAGLDWSNIIAAGGSVVACAMRRDDVTSGAEPLPPASAAAASAARQWFSPMQRGGGSGNAARRSPFADSEDVDLFIHGLSPEEATAKLRHVAEVVRQNAGNAPLVVRSAFAITLVPDFPSRRVQIVLRPYASPLEVLLGFDLDAACFMYDGSVVRALPRGGRALRLGANVVGPAGAAARAAFGTQRFERRLSKYGMRGFAVALDAGGGEPLLCRANVDPALFDAPLSFRGEFDRTSGLARLLLWERLALEDECSCCSGAGPCNQAHASVSAGTLREAMRHATNWTFLSAERFGLPPYPDVSTGLASNRVQQRYPSCDYNTVFLPWGPGWRSDGIGRSLRRRQRWARSVARGVRRDALLRSLGLGVFASRSTPAVISAAGSAFAFADTLESVIPAAGARRRDYSFHGSTTLRDSPLWPTPPLPGQPLPPFLQMHPLPPPGWTDGVHVPADAPAVARERALITLTRAADGSVPQTTLHRQLLPLLPELSGVPRELVQRSTASCTIWGRTGPYSLAPVFEAGTVLRRGASRADAAAVAAALATVRARPARAAARVELYTVGAAPVCAFCRGLCVTVFGTNDCTTCSAVCQAQFLRRSREHSQLLALTTSRLEAEAAAAAAAAAAEASASASSSPDASVAAVARVARVCAGCDAAETPGAARFRKCNRCKRAYFCSEACQLTAWKGVHDRRACSALRDAEDVDTPPDASAA
jgi:hypothetical protein